VPAIVCAGAVGLYFAGFVVLGISPAGVISGLGRLVDIAGLMFPPDPESWSRLLLYLRALGQTLAIAFIGTLLAAVIAFPFGFLAARNVVASRLIHFLSRRSLDTLRSVDTLIWALIWINVVGLGPFAGALAIMSVDMGAFGKLMSEATEAADRGGAVLGGQQVASNPFRADPAIAAGVRQPSSIFLRVQYTFRYDHWDRRRRRHRPSPLGADPRSRVAAGQLYHVYDPDHRGCVGLDLAAAAQRNHRSSRLIMRRVAGEIRQAFRVAAPDRRRGAR
jgi:hypothetical protein